MRPVLLALACVALLAGCSTNQIKIDNQSEGEVDIVFRGSVTSVAKGTSQTITDIPNGTFNYQTEFKYPDGYASTDTSEASAAAGSLTFMQGKTQVYILFGYNVTTDTTGNIYHLTCIESSNNNQAASVTGP